MVYTRRAAGSTLVLSAAVTGAVGFIDLLSGTKISLEILYMVPIGIAAWFGNLRAGALMAVTATAVWFVAEKMTPEGQIAFEPVPDSINLSVRLATFLLLALLLSWSHQLNLRLRTIADRRRASLSRKQAENRRLQRDMSALFGLSRDLICVFSQPGIFRFVNPAWKAVTGHSEERLLGSAVTTLIPPGDREAFQNALETAHTKGQSGAIECRFECADGSFRVLHWMISASATQVYAIAHDTTGRRLLERTVLEVADRQSQRVAMDLHDGLCQRLKGIELILETVIRAGGNDPDWERGRLSKISEEIRNSLQEARSISTGLSPVRETPDGLSVALKDLAASTSRLYGIECQVALPFGEPVLVEDNTVACQLYRVAQEAVSNAARHSRCEAVFITLNRQPDSLSLTIRDNGTGLDESNLTRGSGMEILKFRANLIGATLDFRKADESGTIVSCIVPVSLTDSPHEKRG